jgi:hypothetical protein
MSKVDFQKASIEEILHLYFINGCVLLQNFTKIGNLSKLITLVDTLYKEIDDVHICPRDLRQRSLSQFHEYLFEEKHYVLLNDIFNGAYRVSEDTVTRRIDSVARTGQWTAPLGPHLDAFIHSFAFTVNFWIPFRECGVEAPSLGVVRAPFPEILRFSGYDGNPEANGPAGEWNLSRFDGAMRRLVDNARLDAVEQLRPLFGDRVWTPTYSLGDAMMLSNWTLHFTNASPGMSQRRGNVELRFLSDLTLAEVLSKHLGDEDRNSSSRFWGLRLSRSSRFRTGWWQFW